MLGCLPQAHDREENRIMSSYVLNILSLDAYILSLFIPTVFWAQCEPIISLLCDRAGFSFIFPVVLLLCVVFLILPVLENNNAFDCTFN